jgi:signal peptidase I
VDFDLPLILFIVVAATGFFSLSDFILFRPARMKNIAAAEAQFESVPEEDRHSDVGYLSAIAAASKEPAVIEFSKSFFPVLFLVFFLRSFLFEPFQIPSRSMVPTLEVGDFIVVNKYAYGLRLPIDGTKLIGVNDPKRGDVMVFFPPHDERYFIKRVIGLPGDRIQYTNHQLYINGEAISAKLIDNGETDLADGCVNLGGKNQLWEETIGDASYITRKCSVPGELSRNGIWDVPQGHYFMMGDNRDNSHDSRAWLYVPEKNVVGKAVARWMFWDDFLSIPSFSRAGKI